MMKNNGDRTFTDLGDDAVSFAENKCVCTKCGTRDAEWTCTAPNAFSIADYDADGDLVDA